MIFVLSKVEELVLCENLGVWGMYMQECGDICVCGTYGRGCSMFMFVVHWVMVGILWVYCILCLCRVVCALSLCVYSGGMTV